MTDRDLINDLGGPTSVAKRLGFDLKKGGAQRVHNWMARGIPAKVKLEHDWLRPGRIGDSSGGNSGQQQEAA